MDAKQDTAPARGDRVSVVDPALFQGFEWRCIGPHRGGRVVAVAGDPFDDRVYYFGSTGGGVWKSVDAGQFWENISDGFFKRASVGAIAVAESDPNVLHVGMGESTIRGNVSHGDGVYKSTDRGQSWQHCGLAATRHIAKIRIHPKDADLVYVAALGHAHGPNPERGVYRSRDGGRTWEQVLTRGEHAGAIDLALDPNNPRVLYAAFWETIRTPWSLSSGGPGSGLFKSTDGGDTWTEISRNSGLPTKLLGKIGVAPSPAQSGRVWALIEAEDRPGLYRSDDGGATWELINRESEIRQRPWYYMHIFADPQQPDTVWVLNLEALKSTDGGKTFAAVPTPHGDNHDLWIDPRNPQRLINGSDGGACVSFNGGASWSSIYNQPTAEFYHVVADDQVPYRVYGSQQDNSALSLPSLSSEGAINQTDWFIPGGGESGYIAPRPGDHNIIYAGSYSGTITRYDHHSRQSQVITVWPEESAGWASKDLKYRFQWTFPIAVSPHDPNTLYATGNQVFKSTDEGRHWAAISPDLTRHDPKTLEPSGGPITKDNISTETYATIFAFAESPRQPGLLWAGSDDGLVHISRDGGQSWQDITPNQLPEFTLISIIEPSPHDPACAYLAATRYKLDDFTPYLLKTTDYGQTWTRITRGIPADDFTRVIREDPERRGLLFAGTETGCYISFDDGGNWQPFRTNLPVVPIHDLIIKGSDLLAATHGRSFWILDDFSPLRQLDRAATEAPVHLFQPRRTTRFRIYRGYGNRFPKQGQRLNRRASGIGLTYYSERTPTGRVRETYLDAGQNPPDGVIVYYALHEAPSGELSLVWLNQAGEEIRRFTSQPEPATESPEGEGEAESEGAKPKDKPERLATERGLNRFVWNMRYPDATEVPGAVFWAGNTEGPVVPPGTYQVRLTAGDQSFTRDFEIVKDPRVAATQADLDARFDLSLRIHRKLSEAHTAINQIRDLRRQLTDWERRIGRRDDALSAKPAAEALRERLGQVEEALIQVNAKSFEDTLAFPIKLNNKLVSLAGIVEHGDGAPTSQAEAVYAMLAEQIDTQLSELRNVLDRDVTRLNTLLGEAKAFGFVPASGGE